MVGLKTPFVDGDGQAFFQDFQLGEGCNRMTGGAGHIGTHWGLGFGECYKSAGG
jgi:hypothetical protein